MRSTMYNNPYLAQLNNVNKQLANLANNQKPVNIVNQKKASVPMTDTSIMIMTSFNSNNVSVTANKPSLNTTTAQFNSSVVTKALA